MVQARRSPYAGRGGVRGASALVRRGIDSIISLIHPKGGRRASGHRLAGRAGRFLVFRWALAGVAGILILRLFFLQVLEHGFYEALATGQHEMFARLSPERGDILLKDRFEEKYYPAATNQQLTVIYSDNRKITDPTGAATQLAPLIGREVEELTQILSKPEDPYEPLLHFASDQTADAVRALAIEGIGFAPEKARVYTEAGIGGHLLGFLGSDEAGEKKGRYGIEAWFEKELAGTSGVLRAERDVAGRWIPITDRTFAPAVDGDDVVLTIDRTVQYMACQKIRDAVRKHGATSGLVMVMDPKTGAIVAMCSEPDYDPNLYNEVGSVRLFANPAVSAAWEPGSIMKPLTMAAAVNAGVVAPSTTYEDTGAVEIGPYTIRNSDGKAHGVVDMTTVLEESLNTGAMFAQQQLGKDPFTKAMRDFGFGALTGIEQTGETSADISPLDKPGQIYAATASFGQGITVTPIQMLQAFSALANGGKMMTPFLVSMLRHPDGTTTPTASQKGREVISQRAAALVGGMMVSVVEHGHGTRAGVPGYRVAGKTGTAQIPKKDGPGYEAHDTIGSFIGFAPVEDPRFVMLVRIDRPQDVRFAESTAAPVFGEMAKFLLQYYGVAPN